MAEAFFVQKAMCSCVVHVFFLSNIGGSCDCSLQPILAEYSQVSQDYLAIHPHSWRLLDPKTIHEFSASAVTETIPELEIPIYGHYWIYIYIYVNISNHYWELLNYNSIFPIMVIIIGIWNSLSEIYWNISTNPQRYSLRGCHHFVPATPHW